MKKILTNREKEVFDLLVLGYSTYLISNKLKISVKTVRNHISNVINKLEVRDRTQAIIELIKLDELKI